MTRDLPVSPRTNDSDGSCPSCGAELWHLHNPDCPVLDRPDRLVSAEPDRAEGVEGVFSEALECLEDYDQTGRLVRALRQMADGSVRIDHLTEDQQADIRAHVTGLSEPEEDTYDAPAHGWTCFHCGSTFKTTRGAQMHFGHSVTEKPACHDIKRLVEIYDAAQAAVSTASPARIGFEERIARRDEARSAILAALSTSAKETGQ